MLEEVAEDLRNDPDFESDLPEPLQVLGVQELADSAVVIRVRLKTAPGRQWAVRREFNRRMKLKFDANGIEISYPHRTVYFGEDKDGRAPPLRTSREQNSEPPPRDQAAPAASRRDRFDVMDGSDE